MPKQFKCQNCSAIVRYDPSSHGLKCEYCGSVEVLEVKLERPEEHDLFSAPAHLGWDADVKIMKCDSCGAALASEGKISGKCAFCGSNFVKEQKPNPDIIRPESTVPFKIDLNGATQRFKRWLGKGFFRPGDLKKISRLQLLQGIYTPFWTYDCSAHSDWWAMSGYYYYVSKRVKTSQGWRTTQERKVRWVPSSGSRNGAYNDVLIIASKGLDEGMTKSIYPFELYALEAYRPEFLSGWLAEEYSVTLPKGWLKARRHVESREYQQCKFVVPGDTHRSLSVNTTLSDVTYKHMLLPIWVAAYQYKKKTYHFLINGQTGKDRGEAPISWLKVAAVALAIAASVIAVYFFAR